MSWKYEGSVIEILEAVMEILEAVI